MLLYQWNSVDLKLSVRCYSICYLCKGSRLDEFWETQDLDLIGKVAQLEHVIKVVS